MGNKYKLWLPTQMQLANAHVIIKRFVKNAWSKNWGVVDWGCAILFSFLSFPPFTVYINHFILMWKIDDLPIYQNEICHAYKFPYEIYHGVLLKDADALYLEDKKCRDMAKWKIMYASLCYVPFRQLDWIKTCGTFTHFCGATLKM